MEHVLCHSLIAYCLPLQYRTSLPFGCLQTLQAAVEAYMKLNISEQNEKLDGKCLLWIAIVLASSLDVCAGADDLRQAPVLERVLNRYSQSRTWENVEKTLKTFLWHDELAPQWYATWQSVMRRRRSPTTNSTPVYNMRTNEGKEQDRNTYAMNTAGPPFSQSRGAPPKFAATQPHFKKGYGGSSKADASPSSTSNLNDPRLSMPRQQSSSEKAAHHRMKVNNLLNID
jgi:hypothetical protein